MSLLADALPGMTPSPFRVLVADDEDNLRLILRELLRREGCEVDEAEDGARAVELARHGGYDLYLLDLKMPRLDGMAALREIRTLYPDALAVMITAFGGSQSVMEALRAGAYDYFSKPFNIDELRAILMRALEKQALLRRLHALEQQVAPGSGGRMVAQCPAMREVLNLIDRIAQHDVTVLISGESGTGKELVARAIHAGSPRCEGPFVTVNCAAIPEALLESELFGHERGAFTGAVAARAGRFEAANGGTLFLDEIGELPLALQAKLLRALQQREIERIGSNTPRPVDIRVLTATNRDLGAMVAEKTFREDLYFRLNVVPVQLPPLRERREDLPRLAEFFITEFSTRFGKRVQGLTPAAMALLERYAWPGNVRELENAMQRAVVLAAGAQIDLGELPPAIRAPGGTTPVIEAMGGLVDSASGGEAGAAMTDGAAGDERFELPLGRRVEQIVEEQERRIIVAALHRMKGRRQETADLLGISRKSLHNKMTKYGLFAGGDED